MAPADFARLVAETGLVASLDGPEHDQALSTLARRWASRIDPAELDAVFELCREQLVREVMDRRLKPVMATA
jgi:hypothetical protein